MGRKMKSARRLLALMSAVLMMVTMIPVTTARVTAAAEGHSDSYTVSATAGEGGRVTLNGQAVSALTVDENSDVEVFVQADEGYRISSVIIGEDEQTVPENGSQFQTTIQVTDNVKITVSFMQVFTVTVSCNENGSVTSTASLVDYGTSYDVTVTPDSGYSAGSILVNGTAVTDFIADENGVVTFTVSHVTEEQQVHVDFTETGLYDTEGSDDLKSFFNADDAVRVTDKTYIFGNEPDVVFTTEQERMRLIDEDGKVISSEENPQSVILSSDRTVISKIQLWYQAEGEAAAMWHDVDGITGEDPLVIIIDREAPVIHLVPEEKDENKYYTGNFQVNVSLADVEDDSGVAGIEYFITETEIDQNTLYEEVSEEQKTQQGEIDVDMFLSEDTYKIPVEVNVSQNNSDYVCVWVRTTDRAGNASTARTENLPVNCMTVEISMNGNSECYQTIDGRGYFPMETRQAVITIIDRAEVFDTEAAADGICVTAVDGNGNEIEGACRISEWRSSGDTHEATVSFLKNANYTWSFRYENKAGDLFDTDNDSSVNENIVAPFTFTLDTEIPTGTVTINNNIWDKLLKVLTFGLYNNQKVNITATSHDDISPVITEYYKTSASSALTEEELREAEFGPYEDFSIDKDEQFTVYLKITDAAGNYTYISSDGYIFDQTASRITLTPSDENGFAAESESNGQIYRIYGAAPDEDSGEDVIPVGIKVTEDTESYSGIKTIEYWVESDGRKTQGATLYSFDYVRDPGEGTEEGDDNRGSFSAGTLTITDWNSDTQTNTEPEILKGTHPASDELKESWEGIIEVDKELNNSSNVALHVKTADNAGNENESILMLDIDIADPVFDITFDNGDGYEYADDDSVYFSAGRTAVLKITERTGHFKEDAATAGIVIKAVDAKGNDVSDSDGDGVPDAYRISGWFSEENDGDPDAAVHTATIEFLKDAEYSWSVSYTDEAGNNTNTENIDDLESRVTTGVENGALVAPFRFTIDTTAPAGTVKAVSSEGREEEWNTLRDNLTFGFWSGDKITVSGTQDDATSPIASVEYYKVSVPAADGTILLTAEQLDAVTAWQPFGNLEISQDGQFVVYIKITDRAGNYSYLSTNGLIVDHARPDIEALAPGITINPIQPANGFYNSNVDVEISVTDPMNGGTYSGLKTVTYRVLNMGTVTQSGTLYQFENTDPSQAELQQSWSGMITVDCAQNNSNDVVIEVYAEDNALNSSDKNISIKIDITAPVIDVSYDNNSADSSTYFNRSRTATIVVTERNFDPEDVRMHITNTEGEIPSLSSWTKTEGTGNGDDTRWTATLTYASDGDYTFDIQYTDPAGNVSSDPGYGDSAAPTEFTIDKTLPAISVSYNNNNAVNGRYFSAPRTATVVVTEHNFDVSRVVFIQTASLGESSVAVPSVSWSSSGDVHTATVSWVNDGEYTFEVTMTDLAGNESNEASYGESIAAKDFVIDQTIEKPVIGGVENGKAYTEDVIPAISFNDINYASCEITLLRTGKGERDEDVTAQFVNAITENGQGGSCVCDTFDRIVENDGIYTLTVRLTDLAGNEETETVTFTINRFGSVYEYSEYLAFLIKDGGQYITVSGSNDTAVTEDLVITEYSAEQLLDGSADILITRDGESIDADYTANPVNINSEIPADTGGWYEYEYTIGTSNFKEDGVYRISLTSKYEAADSGVNESSSVPDNSTDSEGNPILDTMSFTVDTTCPEIRNIKNLEEDIVNARSVDVGYTIVDVGGLASVEILVNGESVEAVTEFGENTFSYSDSFILTENSEAQTVRLIATDRAGNVTDTGSDDFSTNDMYVFHDTVTVSKNLFVRWYANQPLFWETMIGAIVIVGGVRAIVMLARKKNAGQCRVKRVCKKSG